MGKDIKELIDAIEALCRAELRAGNEVTYVGNQDILDIFAAFRLEIIKASGRNA